MTATTAIPAVRRSNLQADVVRSLTRIRSRTDRVRARATTAAATGMGVALLIVGAVATLEDTIPTGSTMGYGEADGTTRTVEVREPVGGLAAFLAQEGLRPGVIVAGVLLVLPFLALAVQALRVGKVVEERRSRQLLTAGATWHDLRRLKVARTTAAFVGGGFLAAPSYLLLWLVLGLALPAGSRLLPPPAWPLALAWLAVVGVLWLAGRGLAVASVRADHAAALRRAGISPRAPSRRFVLLFGASGAVLLITPFTGVASALFPVFLVIAVVLLVVAAGAGAARWAVGDEPGRASLDEGLPPHEGRGRTAGVEPGALPWRLRGRDVAVSVLADAQRRGNAVAVSGTAGVLFVCGLSFGVESALVAQSLDPESSGGNYTTDDIAFYVGGAALAGAIGVVAAVVAIAALLLSLTDHLLSSRRAVAATAALGTESRRLLAVQARCLIRTAVPVTVLGLLVAAVPYTFALSGSLADGWSWTVLLPLAVAVITGLLVAVLCRLLALALSGRVRAAAAVENLRVA